jgi:hypothetical protein
MSSIAICLIVFGFAFGGALFGRFLSGVLPKTHMEAASRDVVKLTMGLLVTLTALVLGLLIGSARSSFDTQAADVAVMSAKLVLLDHVLANYGPEAKGVRELLRDLTVRSLDQLWPQARSAASIAPASPAGWDELYKKIQALAPTNDLQRSLQAQATSVVVGLGETRWLMYAQASSSVSKPMLAILIFWLTMIFISFGLSAPANATVTSALLVCALSVTGAIFLILELYAPYGGLITVSSGPLRNALAQLGQ